jgi:26S proteasome regulatory subunit N10
MLEAVMMVLDNSEYSRNGDYPPSRLDAQKDAATLLFNAKTQVYNQNNPSPILKIPLVS